MTDNENNLKEVEHHKQQDLCITRPPYRQGRKQTAVKVYTVTSESQHLFIYGVPKIKLRNELKALCTRYGQVKNLHAVVDYKTEIFTECYHVQYERIQSARVAKRVLDTRSFYGGLLHVCYAPEFETVQETRSKLTQRKRDVIRRLQSESEVNNFSSNGENYTDNHTSFIGTEASCSSGGKNYTVNQGSFIGTEASCNSGGENYIGNHTSFIGTEASCSSGGDYTVNQGRFIGMEASCNSGGENYIGNHKSFIDTEASYRSQYQINNTHVKTSRVSGKFSRKRKTFGEFEDPLLAINTEYEKREEIKQVGFSENCVESNEKKLGEYGPFLENYIPQMKRTNIKEMPKLIPSQVISNKKCAQTNKRIVFRKK